MQPPSPLFVPDSASNPKFVQTQRQTDTYTGQTFNSQLVSKVNEQAGVVAAADHIQKQDVEKKRKKELLEAVSSFKKDDEESIYKTVKTLKKKLRALHSLERRSLGI